MLSSIQAATESMSFKKQSIST